MKKSVIAVLVIGLIAAFLMQKVIASDRETLKAQVIDEARIIKDLALDRHIDAVAANTMATSLKVPIVDVRTLQEYQLVGHIPGTRNIPFASWGKWDEQKKAFGWEPNPDFVQQFANTFSDKSKAYIIMCRSGHRSGKAIKLLTDAGYTNLYQMWDGFEGLDVKDKASPNFGKKAVDGWKVKGLPYTYEMDPQLVVMR
jgi:rhodanese-related sulfurtransferase